MASKKISQLTAATTPLIGTEEFPIVQGGQTVKATINDVKPPYKVYTALLTQSGGDNLQGQYGGTLVIGRTYKILDTGDPSGDWTNVGAPNNNLDTYFVATGEIPNSWGDGGGLSYNEGAPVVTVLENTIGNIWFTYDSVGNYYANSNGLFTENKTILSFLSIFPTPMAYNENILVNFERVSNSQLVLAIGGDGYLGNTPIEIRVYN